MSKRLLGSLRQVFAKSAETRIFITEGLIFRLGLKSVIILYLVLKWVRVGPEMRRTGVW